MYHPSVIAASLDLTRAGSAGPGAAWGEAGDPSCGDAVRIELAVTDGLVVRARHRSFACPHATAAASLACRLSRGARPAGRRHHRRRRAGERAAAGSAQPRVRGPGRRRAARGDRAGARPRADAGARRPRRRRHVRRGGQRRRLAEGARGRAAAGGRDAAALDRPRCSRLGPGLLLAAVGASGPQRLPRGRRTSRHARSARPLPVTGGGGLRARPRRGHDAQPVHALQRQLPVRRPGRLRRPGGRTPAGNRPLRPDRGAGRAHRAGARRRPGQGPVLHAGPRARADPVTHLVPAGRPAKDRDARAGACRRAGRGRPA